MPELPADLLRRAGTTIRRVADEVGESRHLGDLLMALADEMADYPAVLVPNGVGIESRPNQPSAVWTAAYRFAADRLGEAIDD